MVPDREVRDAASGHVTLSTLVVEGTPPLVDLGPGQQIVAAKLIRRDKYSVTVVTESPILADKGQTSSKGDDMLATSDPRVLGVLQTIHRANRKLDGANYDLSRDDKHPNDAHKALIKITEASRLLADVAISLREGFDV